MQDGNERLAQDVAALGAMAGQMAEYLDSDILFWPLGHNNMPMLTLGGYLLREHRLLALANLLTPEQRAQVDAAVFQFNQALADRVVRFEAKAHHELEARLRQWTETLKEMEHGTLQRSSNYATVVETRAMIHALLDRLGDQHRGGKCIFETRCGRGGLGLRPASGGQQGERSGLAQHPHQIGKWPGWVSTVIHRVSVKLSMPCLPPNRP